MDREINCFHCQNTSSAYLEGSLTEENRKALDQHLTTCAACKESFDHYRVVLSAITSLPRATLPEPIRKAPLMLHRLRGEASLPAPTHRSFWRRIPWYIRTTMEGTAVVFLVLGAINAAPKIRDLYEKSTEQSVSELNESFSDSLGKDNQPIPAPQVGKVVQQGSEQARANEEDFQDDNESSANEGQEPEESPLSAEPTAGSSEIWRFTLKTDSPKEVRVQVVKILTDLRVPANTPGLAGIEAPGGIQFDLMLGQAVIPTLKRQLQRLAPPPPSGTSGSTLSDTFAWYKNKSRRRLPQGKTRVVIWLSQI